MKLIISILLTFMMLLAPHALQAARKKGVEKALNSAWNARNKEPDVSLKTAREALAGNLGEITKEQKISAYDLQYEIYKRKRQWDKTIEVLEEQLKAFSKDPEVDRKVIFRKSDIYRQKRKEYDKIVEQLHEFVKRNQKEGELCAEVLHRSSDFLRDSKKYSESYADAEKALKLAAGNLQLEINSLWKMQDIASRMKDENKRANAILDSLKPKYREYMRDRDVEYRISMYADSLYRLKRFNEQRRFLEKEIKIGTNPERNQEWARKIADSFYEEKKYQDALDAYEKVISEHPTVTRQWRGAQDRRIECLTQLKKFKEALQEMRIVFDDCNHEGDVRWSCERIAHLFWEIDKNSDRADLFIGFQILGPAGLDKKIGTADDLKNPLLQISYPNLNRRRQILEKTIAESGDSASEARYRGLAYIYSGQPTKALPQFIDGLRRYTGKQYNYPVIDVVLRGIRAVKADSHSVPNATNYILYGPNGKDGKKGTEDDAVNPFKGIKIPPGKTSDNEKAELKTLWQELSRLAANPKEERNRRRYCLQALKRIYETAVLNPQEIYKDTIKILQNGADRHSTGDMLCLALAACRKYQPGLQPIAVFRKELPAILAKTEATIDRKSANDVWKNLSRSISTIEKSTKSPKLRLPKSIGSTPKKKKKPKKKK